MKSDKDSHTSRRTHQQARQKLAQTAIEDNTAAGDIVDLPHWQIDRHSDSEKLPCSQVKVVLMRMGVLVTIPLHWPYSNQ